MASPTFRAPFLKRLHRSWAQRLPALKPGSTEPIWWAEPDCTLHRRFRHREREVLVHLSVLFTPKWPGAFTADVTISPPDEPLPYRPATRWDDHLPDLLPGQYRIGWFARACDYWWHLKDEDNGGLMRRMEP